jgi:hypothetical protein
MHLDSMLISNCYERFSFVLGGTGLWTQSLVHLIHTSSPFSSGYFGYEVSRTICPGWPQTVILPPISASQVASMSHQHKTAMKVFKYLLSLPVFILLSTENTSFKLTSVFMKSEDFSNHNMVLIQNSIGLGNLVDMKDKEIKYDFKFVKVKLW